MPEFYITSRVTYKDTDKMGVAYYANYLVWFEVCRTEYFRSRGYPYVDLEKKNIFLPVVEAHCYYKAAVSYDDEINIYLSSLFIKGIRLTFNYVIKNKATAEIVAEGYTTHVFIDEKRKPLKIPAAIREVIEG